MELTKVVLGEYLSQYHGQPVQVLDLKELGDKTITAIDTSATDATPLKLFGYGRPLQVHYRLNGHEQHVVLRMATANEFGHENRADRAADLLLSYDTYNTLPRHVAALDVGVFCHASQTPQITAPAQTQLLSLGKGNEFFLLTPYVDGEPYALDLQRLRDGGDLQERDLSRVRQLASYLAQIHALKYSDSGTNNQPSPSVQSQEILYRRRIRETMGSGEGIMGLLDSYPVDDLLVTPAWLEAVEKECITWRWRLKDKSHRLCQVHGDYHPFNILFTNDDEFVLLDRSRGAWGEAADDVSCLAINYLFFSLQRTGRLAPPKSWPRQNARCCWSVHSWPSHLLSIVTKSLPLRPSLATCRLSAWKSHDAEYASRKKMLRSLARKKDTMASLTKILIGYDGSPCADVALNDLQRAGLPRELEATVLSVADVWLVPTNAEGESSGNISPIVQQASATAARLLTEAHSLAEQGAEVVQKRFPDWLVRAQSCADSPAWGLILKAEEWQPDLIVVGAHNHSPLRRLVLGSVSHTVMTQARCSVRVARAWGTMPGRPLRILVGVDGSVEAEAAVQEVAVRCWPPESDIRLITVIDPSMLTAVASGSLRHQAQEDLQTEELNTIVDRMLAASADIVRLRAPGMSVSTQLDEGDPRHVLVEEAERWGADCIFVGSRGLNRLERLLFGSVATAVATRASCSVEVVRPTPAFVGASDHLPETDS